MGRFVDHFHYGDFPEGGEVGSSEDGFENVQEKKDCFGRKNFVHQRICNLTCISQILMFIISVIELTFLYL